MKSFNFNNSLYGMATQIVGARVFPSARGAEKLHGSELPQFNSCQYLCGAEITRRIIQTTINN